MARVGEQARQLLRGRSRVEQRAEAGRDRGHRHHSRRPGPATGETMPGPSLRPVARSATFAGVDGIISCSRLGCSEPAVAVFAFDARECLVWLDPISTPGRGAGVLCDTPRRPHVAAAWVEPARPPRPRVTAVDGPRRRRLRPGRAHAPRARASDPPAHLHPGRSVAAVRRGRAGRPGSRRSGAAPAPWSPHDQPGPGVRARARRPHADAGARVRVRPPRPATTEPPDAAHGGRRRARPAPRARARGRRGRGRTASR